MRSTVVMNDMTASANLFSAAWDSVVQRRGCRRPSGRGDTVREVMSLTDTARTTGESSYECDILATTSRRH